MPVSYWRRIVGLRSLGLLVIPAVSSSQGNPGPKIIEGPRRKGNWSITRR